MTLFEVTRLTHYFGGLRAVSGFDLRLTAGELVGLVGPNGAGKTTVFNIISGVYKPTAGSIVLDDFDITGLAPYKIARLGIARTFQNIRLFQDMSVVDNVKVACQRRIEYGALASLLHPRSFWEEERRLHGYCVRLLAVFGLKDAAQHRAASLPYGMQRRLEMARALATSPRLLLLDEPAAGMNPREARDLVQTIRQVRKEFGPTILVIEHNMHVVMNLCERVVVMDFGEVIAQGTPSEIRSNPAVVEAYLGKAGAHAA